MEENFNQNDFEEFLQDQVRNHKMYPSDSVWREIDKKLHGEKRWPALTIAASVVLTATVLICVYFTPKPSIFTVQPATANNPTRQIGEKGTLANITTNSPFLIQQPKYSSAGSTPSSIPGTHSKRGNSGDVDAQTYEPGLVLNKENAGRKAKAASSKILPVVAAPVLENQITVSSSSENTAPTVESELQKTDLTAALITDDSEDSPKVKGITEAGSITDHSDKKLAEIFFKEHKQDRALHSSLKKTSLRHKFSYQIYAAPSISFRELLEDNSMTKEGKRGPVALNYVTDVNKVVRHKPGTGIEVGVSFMYHLSDVVRLKSGFQFNMRQYSIEAYRSSTELASIALLGNNRMDTVKTLSFYRNNNGFYSAELVNRYYQLSVPVGIEWEIFGGKKIRFNVAGTIQPTYLFNRNAYLLSTNFKNYAESPGMVRQWNLNSNIETFISFKVGDFKWQLGPQLRYQPYSTFIPEYPIKEHLMDYGLKLGVSSLIK